MARRKRPSADVAAWIETLLSSEPQDDEFARAKALFDFSSYLRWPSDEELRDLASVIMTARYVTATLMPGPDPETPIPSDCLPSLFRYANPTKLVSVILDQKAWEVSYEDLAEDDRQRTAANIVRFLISETSKKVNRTEQPSIKH
jgi:hypothetical protein